MARKTTASQKTETQAAIFKALADPTRLELVKHLCHQREPDALCVNALAGKLGISQPAVSQHLRILKGIGLVKGVRQGYCIHYGIDHRAMRQCHATLAAALAGENPPQGHV